MFVMAHHPSLRLKARELRQAERLTIDQLAERLALPRTTVYYWVRDMPIPTTTARTVAGQRKGNLRMQRSYRQRREAAYEQGRAEFDLLASDPTFRDFVCMYIGEGYKRRRNTVSLANSDPAVVVLADRWIRRYARNATTYSVQYHADQDLADLCRFWSTTLGIPVGQIRLQRKSNSGSLNGRRWRSRYGVLTVLSNDTALRARLQGWIDRLQESWV